MSDQGVTGGDVWLISSSVVASAGGQPPAWGPPVDPTPNRPASANWIAWDGNDAIFIGKSPGVTLALYVCECRITRHPLRASTLRSSQFRAKLV